MNYLLDTHTFIWLDIENDNSSSELSETARLLLADPENVLLLSLVSVWEMQIKSQLGKLTLRLPLEQIVREQLETNHIQLLPITLNHILSLQDLPHHHRDPFDRLLIAQAVTEQIPIIGRDAQMEKYTVDMVW